MTRSKLSALVALLLLPGVLHAQEQDRSGPLILHLPGGARALALGDAFVAGRGPEVLFYNPAQIAQAPGLLLSGARYGSASTHVVLASTLVLGSLTLGVGAQYLDYSVYPFEPQTRVGELGQRYESDASNLAGTLAASYTWHGIRWGAAAKYVQVQLFGSRRGVPLFDFGVGREFGRYTVGLAVQNVGPGYTVGSYPDRPTRVTLGAVLPRRPIGTYFDIGASTAVTRERTGRITPRAGVELYYQPLEGWLFVLRAGARRVEAGNGPRMNPLTFGAGIGLDRISLDYGFESIEAGRSVHRVGVRVQ